MDVTIIIWAAIFVFSLLVLLKSSGYFTNAAEKIGLLLGMPAFIVGVTIVAIGTSLPELISSIFAVSKNSSEIVIGNVIGSNIANILLILAVVAIVAKKIETKYEILKVDLPIFFASALFVFITCMDGVFNFWEGIIGIIGVIIYFTFAAKSVQKSGSEQKVTKTEKIEVKKEGLWLQFGIVFLSGIFIFLAAKYTIESVIKLSEIFNIGKDIIAISAVALGTSLPEMFVGIQAARKGNAGLAFGNVLGSNIFNSFAVLGIPALFGPLIIPTSIITFSIPVMIGISILYFFMIQDRQMTIWEGLILLLAYILYLAKIFALF
jgi:cation:H+ antiporter